MRNPARASDGGSEFLQKSRTGQEPNYSFPNSALTQMDRWRAIVDIFREGTKMRSEGAEMRD